MRGSRRSPAAAAPTPAGQTTEGAPAAVEPVALSQEIARAFSLGVIASRALCLLLALLSADYQDTIKQRSPIRGGRPGVVVVRIKTGGRNIWV